MESDEEVDKYKFGSLSNPFTFCTKLISLQAEIFSNCVVTLASPFFSLISLVSDMFRGAPEPKGEFQPHAVSSSSGGGRRIAAGLAAAAYVLMVLLAAMFVAAVLGVGLVRAWAEEPVYMRESLQFDYTDAHPTALLSFGDGAAVPPGHTIYVSLALLMPDSDYNRDVGIFQLTAELISTQGKVIAKSSHPSMLRFRSWPIRYTRTFFMGVPLLLGIISETQRVTFPALKHKEASFPRTGDIRITLMPRAGTLSLPQFYDAELIVNSRPPWAKEVVYRWKLTFCVWTTLYIFVMFVVFLVIFLKPLIFPAMATPMTKYEQEQEQDYSASAEEVVSREDREVSESLQRWQRSRIKRKAALLQSSASSMTVNRGEGCPSLDKEGSGDSESVCS